MKINWKVRFKNGAWLLGMASLIVTFVYTLLDMLDVIPDVGQEYVMNIIKAVLSFFGMIGVITDPTTSGVGDSTRAMGYTTPWNDHEAGGGQNG